MTPAEVRTAWPIVADATDAQLSVAITIAEQIVAADLSTALYNDALSAVAAHIARLRLEASGAVTASQAGKVRAASFANHSVTLAEPQADTASRFENDLTLTEPGRYYLRVYGALNAGLPLYVSGGWCP